MPTLLPGDNIVFTSDEVADTLTVTAVLAGPFMDYAFNATVAEPPGGGQVRLDSADQAAASKVWISNVTSPGVDVRHVLAAAIKAGSVLVLQDKDNADRYMRWTASAAPVDKTTYWEVPVSLVAAGTQLSPQRVLFYISP